MPASTEELATSYAALILADADKPVTAADITALLKAAKINASPVWAKLFQQVFETRKVSDFLISGVSSGMFAFYFQLSMRLIHS